ncbi:hypothetical protein L226DRAFT_496659 [Lentinus tigrinus ALCF2SS1-7]|uniref:uncharacterized protein n=1 Tax=Lentinus tigrinus ALCF2SS1-7 TaxID=1328758 RepID=UPI001165D40F|nr:hypothetical protein L226DRAFT_496659 [Lentinus tigrinus ALCF2SS1-7]
MSERGIGKPWTTQEDNLLIQAVAIHGENDNWKAVAALVPGRTNKACRKRWLHSLSPNVKKTAWTPEEDQLLISLYATHGTKWSVIARHIPGRTDDACSKRYREALDPSLKRDDWTYDEDVKLLEVYARLGGKWGLIGQELNRSGLGCRNRWRMLERKRAALSRDATSRGEGPTSAPEPQAPGTSNSQWTPTHVQDPQFWDGRSPQYVTPSVLYQGSPLHSQESHVTTYSPEQILSGVHLSGSLSSQRDATPFQYATSSLSAALSHPGSVAQSPEPHGYYHSAALSPRHASSGLSEANVPAPTAQSGTYGSHEYEFMPIEDHHSSTTPESSHHDSGHVSHSAPANAYTGPLDIGIPPLPIPDTPASPSLHGSPSPPGSPAVSAGNQIGDPAVSRALADAPPRRSYYRTAEEKAASQPPPRKSIQRPARLSSNLPATSDANVLAYACGHADCWPAGASSSKNAFLTSKELSDHSRFIHGGYLGGSKPFRCGLTGCEKSWKSLNGLQYHLQISRYHFQQALAARGGDPDVGGTDAPNTLTSEIPRSDGEQSMNLHQDDLPRSTAEAEAEAQTRAITAMLGTSTAPAPTRKDAAENTPPEKSKRKLHSCTRPGCTKAYKQLSGLRYHLTHGHVDELPLQLDVVPPTLARIVAEKAAGSGSDSAPRP